MLDVLTRQSGDWDDEDYREFADNRLGWAYYGELPEQQQRITEYVYYSKRFIGLYYGVDAVIEVDEATLELRLTPWPEILNDSPRPSLKHGRRRICDGAETK